jgi:hypothetical protein
MAPKPLTDDRLSSITELGALSPEGWSEMKSVEAPIELDLDFLPVRVEESFSVWLANSYAIGALAVIPGGRLHGSSPISPLCTI